MPKRISIGKSPNLSIGNIREEDIAKDFAVSFLTGLLDRRVRGIFETVFHLTELLLRSLLHGPTFSIKPLLKPKEQYKEQATPT
jgi:hypothetical protein